MEKWIVLLNDDTRIEIEAEMHQIVEGFLVFMNSPQLNDPRGLFENVASFREAAIRGAWKASQDQNDGDAKR